MTATATTEKDYALETLPSFPSDLEEGMQQRYRTILLFGAPGSGKGTIGKALGAIPGFVHVACDRCNDWVDDKKRDSANSRYSNAQLIHVLRCIEWTTQTLFINNSANDSIATGAACFALH